jgi:hypothetical protein
MRTIGKLTTTGVAAAVALSLTAVTSFAASNYEGTWKVKDTQETLFEIVLAPDGTAAAHRGDEDMSGTWNDENGVAVIRWTEGWTTKIAKAGDGYKKSAYKGDTGGAPTHTSDAVKK